TAEVAGGFSDNEASPPGMEFVSSGEGLQLSLAFMKIKDPKLRKRVLDLVKQMAEDSEDEKERGLLLFFARRFLLKAGLAFARLQGCINVIRRDAARRPNHQQVVQHVRRFRGERLPVFRDRG